MSELTKHKNNYDYHSFFLNHFEVRLIIKGGISPHDPINRMELIILLKTLK